MGRYLLLALLLSLAAPAGAAAMDMDDMMKLPGAELLTLRANEVVERLGPPAAIRDHGRKDVPRHEIALGGDQVALSDEPWNLIYGKFPGRIGFEWVNPQPSTPRELKGLDTLVVYTHPDREVLDLDKKSGKLVMRRPVSELEEHAIYGIASIPASSITWEDFIRRWGPPDEETVDEKQQPVSRYWVKLDLESVPVALFAVDAMKGPRGDVISIAIYNARTGFVAERLRQMWDDLPPDALGPEPDAPNEIAPSKGETQPGWTT
jgi:hypothetical protein